MNGLLHPSATPVTFVVTDIETDGHSPLRNSMLSFASVAVGYDGTVHDTFQSVLERRPDRKPDPLTMQWWEGFPEAYAAATRDPRPPKAEMNRYA
ncbi:MAG TPA: exonuclease, partial [Devosia sp.]|nr:exonuclease [Devosia sp.]